MSPPCRQRRSPTCNRRQKTGPGASGSIISIPEGRRRAARLCAPQLSVSEPNNVGGSEFSCSFQAPPARLQPARKSFKEKSQPLHELQSALGLVLDLIE